MNNRSRILYRIIILECLILGGFISSLQAQYFWNTDFEYEVYNSQPRKWAIEGEGQMYTASIDSLVSKSGDRSLFLSLTNAETYTFLRIPGELAAGKSISVQGYIKTHHSDSLQTRLIAFNPTEGNIIASSESNGGTGQWKTISFETMIPESLRPENLLIALMANGTGSFWFDEVQVKIDGKIFGTNAPDFREPYEREIALLNKKAVPVKMEKTGDDYSDLKVLSDVTRNARLVALGENSHGSSSIYKLKLRMIKYLVEQEQFSIFALEMPTVEAAYINNYVLNGGGNIDEIVNKLTYPSWQTQEMIDIIQWMKEYNEQHTRNIEFMGFDMQNGWSALNAVKNFADSFDSVLLAELEVLEELYEEALEDGQPQEALFEKSVRVADHLNRTSYPEISSKKLAGIRHFMDVFLQSISFQFHTENSKRRDEYMAENIRWIVENASGTGKVILSADNTHITKTGGKTGAFLSRWYKEDYISFGFTFQTGTYSAYGPEPFYEVHPPYVGTYEYFFSKSQFENFILDLRDIKQIPMLNEPAGFRSIGSRPQETTQFYEIDIKKHFDVVVFMKKSKHTLNLNK